MRALLLISALGLSLFAYQSEYSSSSRTYSSEYYIDLPTKKVAPAPKKASRPAEERKFNIISFTTKAEYDQYKSRYTKLGILKQRPLMSSSVLKSYAPAGTKIVLTRNYLKNGQNYNDYIFFK